MTEPKNNKDNIGEQKECKCCFQQIHISAKVCNHCGRHQNFWVRHFGDTAIIVSIVMVVIAAVQMFGAIKQNIDASSALEKAESAAADANHALAQVISDASEINKLKHVIDNQGAQIEFVSKMAFKAENLLSKIVELQKESALINKFMITVFNAQNDDRKAFEQLKIWADDKTFFLYSDAFKAYAAILDEHDPPLFREPPNMSWKQGIDPAKLNLVDLKHEYEIIPWYFKPSIIKYIYERNDLSKYEKLEFLIEIVKNDPSLRAVTYAGHCLKKETGLQVKTLAISKFIEWWENNKDKIK